MPQLVLTLLAITLLPAAAFAHCSSALLPLSVDSVIEDLMATVKSVESRPEFERAAYELLTGLSLPEASFAHDSGLVRRLVPVQGWKEVIRIIDWKGHVYTEIPGLKETRIYNTFWGRPINLKEQDHLLVALHHRTGANTNWINIVVGPVDPSEVEKRNLRRKLIELGLVSGSTLNAYAVGDSAATDVLVLNGIRHTIDSYRFLQKLIYRFQDRYFTR